MRALRGMLGVAGAVAIGFGVWSMRDFEFEQLWSMIAWLIGGVVVHDFVLAPVVVVVGVTIARVVPGDVRTPLAVGLVLWGTLTLIALPALSGLGVRSDNPSLLDRPYLAAWLLCTALTAVVVSAYVWLRRGGRR